MYVMDNRALKDLLYEQVARVGKALASPKRLEILEMLAQGEKAVETVATEVAIASSSARLAEIGLAIFSLPVLREYRLRRWRPAGGWRQ